MTTRASALLATAAARVTPTTLGSRLRQIRRAKGITQRDASKHLRRTLEHSGDPTYLSKIENDHEACSRSVILALASLYDADADELLTLAGKVPEDVAAMLVRSEGARRFYRVAVDRQLTESQWELLTEVMKRMVVRRPARERVEVEPGE